MKIGVAKELYPKENRVAMVPAQVPKFTKSGHSVFVEEDAGIASGFPNEEYSQKGATIASKERLYSEVDVLFTVRSAAAAGNVGIEAASRLHKGQTVIGLMDPYQAHKSFTIYQEKEITSFALEKIPRITRAQSMDVLSSMANLAGYKSVIIAADYLPQIFPMLMTAAGTIVPARLFVLGVGVAGLQAIATARRLGAIVSAYDVRPAVKEQVESLGARFLAMDIESESAEGAGGYAREMDKNFYAKQQQFLEEALAEMDVVITTAAIPGKKSPVLITESMVKGMKPGSVIVDLAVERGGNCELSKLGKAIVKHNVNIVGPNNVASELARHASQLYGRNIETFFFNAFKDGTSIQIDDEIVAATLLTHMGKVPEDETRKLLGLK